MHAPFELTVSVTALLVWLLHRAGYLSTHIAAGLMGMALMVSLAGVAIVTVPWPDALTPDVRALWSQHGLALWDLKLMPSVVMWLVFVLLQVLVARRS
ncbi:hypothetical protein [Vibrio coralliilyticus]|uniref:hypothetical protein n=1 Tax=Vibrio coralliilyticus TaxID=190893 RepID=UPI0006CC1B43|nr:hypothetical protein [Vibrio coralliilyticus]AXN34828.1 hypothetical protein DVV14_26505 [Vibrio coralliilyticus]KPH24983.1 hypothetical protein ADU60_15905 [Vibrio coralliilyticus]MCC2524216.1 hypothetical protein [Vibrio coralliilyticus]